MKRFAKIAGVAAVATCIATTGVLLAACKNDDTKLNEALDEVTRLEGELDVEKGKVAGLTGDKEALEKELDAISSLFSGEGVVNFSDDPEEIGVGAAIVKSGTEVTLYWTAPENTERLIGFNVLQTMKDGEVVTAGSPAAPVARPNTAVLASATVNVDAALGIVYVSAFANLKAGTEQKWEITPVYSVAPVETGGAVTYRFGEPVELSETPDAKATNVVATLTEITAEGADKGKYTIGWTFANTGSEITAIHWALTSTKTGDADVVKTPSPVWQPVEKTGSPAAFPASAVITPADAGDADVVYSFTVRITNAAGEAFSEEVSFTVAKTVATTD